MKHLIKFNETHNKNVYNVESILLELEDAGKIDNGKAEQINKNTIRINIKFPDNLKGMKLLNLIDTIYHKLNSRFEYIYIIGGNFQIDLINMRKSYIKNSVFDKIYKLLHSIQVIHEPSNDFDEESGQYIGEIEDSDVVLAYEFEFGYEKKYWFHFDVYSPYKLSIYKDNRTEEFFKYVESELLLKREDIVDIMVNFINDKYNTDYTIEKS